MKRALKWFQPPVFADKEKTLIARQVQVILLTFMVIGLLLGVIDALEGQWITLVRITGGILVLLFAYGLNRRGNIRAASYLLALTVLSVLTLELITDQGIHDISILLYPVIILLASLLLHRKGVLLITLSVLVSIGIVVLGEIRNWFPHIRENVVNHITRPIDALNAFLMVLVGTIITYRLSRVLLDMLSQSRKNANGLADINQLLVQQTNLLRDSEMRWRSLIETVPSDILSVTRDGTIQFHNKVKYQDRVVGKKVFDFIPVDQWETVHAIIENVFETGERAYYEGIIRFNGDRWFSLSVGPVRGEDGRVTSLTVIAMDMDDYRRAMDELSTSQVLLKQQADQLLALNRISREVSALSDLKTTLQNILNQIQAVLSLDVFYVALFDPEKRELSFPILYDSGRLWDEPPMQIPKGSWLDAILESRQPAIINRSLEEIEHADPAILLGDRTKKSASILIAPMVVSEHLVGIISAQSYTLNAYQEEHLALLTGISYPTAIAIENARLYDLLQKELQERRRIENEIRQLNIELEERVSRRTAELKNANQELEAFTYSISHDLRAPLRAIDGYAHILSEEFKNNLPEEAILYLQRIHAGVDRMNRLIDDLLLFSRTTRQPLKVKGISSEELTGFAQEIAALVHAAAPERKVEWRMSKLPGCRADPNLLRQVIMNLLDNAFKYTRKREPAVIEMGGQELDDKVIYFVRDNGIGFDMRYAEKLFSVFQRLHLPEEYEGTGVGLAIVQRIIQRHGGEVWAEAEPDKGAVFYFSLGRNYAAELTENSPDESSTLPRNMA